MRSPAICIAPLYRRGGSAAAEGFTDVAVRRTFKTGNLFTEAVATGKVDLALNFSGPARHQPGRAAHPIVILAGIHAGCFELFGSERVRAIRDLKGKTVAMSGPGQPQHVFARQHAGPRGPRSPRGHQLGHPSVAESARLLAEGKIDAYPRVPAEPQELRARKIGRLGRQQRRGPAVVAVLLLHGVANRDFVRQHPVATKRALRAILKAADLCARGARRGGAEPSWPRASRRDYDYALQTLIEELPYNRWREYNPEDTVRFYALRLHEAGMIKASPQEDHRRRHRLAVPQRAEEGAEGLTRSVSRTAAGLAVACVLSVAMPALAHQPGRDARLPTIGAAPPFALTTADGGRLALADLRGKVAAVTFIYATCTDTCPLLTAKLAALGKRMGKDFGAKVAFVAITVDPERDTPDVLRSYAQAHGARGAGWAFLTGTPAEIKDVAQRYGVFARKTDRGDVDHTFLTSLVDRDGALRVQYMGVRFDPDEMLRDLRSLLREGGR